MRMRAHIQVVTILLACLALPVHAGPYSSAGDPGLRHDIQRLADFGVIPGPVTTWPIAWGQVVEALSRADASQLPASILASYVRVKDRAAWETRTGEPVFVVTAALADNTEEIRSFKKTPRGRGQLSAGMSWTDDWFSVDLQVQGVDSNQDPDSVRVDGSRVGVVLGNWSVAASTQDRWWGPGWDGSLILSNNARPIPALVLDRVFPDPFTSRWLSWIGPWDANVIAGEMERGRSVPSTRFFGMRVNFRPLDSLEIGLSRTAQWCGDGRPCGFDTFVDLLLGQDNLGDAGIGVLNEPGNQLAGVDFRWVPALFRKSVAIYGQFIGEDEAGGFPSRFLGQLGGEWSGYLEDKWSVRAFAEFAGTSCQFYESSELFNCAYNHSVYQSGYRYRSRVIGHSADNDARMISIGLIAIDDADTRWQGLVRYGSLNRGGPPDPAHSLTQTPQDLLSLDLSHSRAFRFGTVDLGIGMSRIDDFSAADSSNDYRVYLEWRSGY